MSELWEVVKRLAESVFIAAFLGLGTLIFISPIIVRMVLPPNMVTLPLRGSFIGLALIIVGVEMISNRCKGFVRR